MKIVRLGPQYRQDPHFWDTDLSPDRAKNRRLPSAREIGLSVGPWTGKALYKTSFSTVSLAGFAPNQGFENWVKQSLDDSIAF